MTSLLDYDFLMHDVFYKCWPILEYIEKHPSMSELDKEAIKATIMDALVYKGLIDPEKQSLDLENMCIRDGLDYYRYDPHPNICGIPQWMKEEFRHRCLLITAGNPISVFIAKPPSKYLRYCVYDPNTAVSSIFPDATFYNVFYTSPTRGIRIESKRPFVEVEIDGVLYLVDTITKRIFKSSYFKETYGFEIVDEPVRVSELTGKNLEIYKEHTSPVKTYDETITFIEMIIPNLVDDPSQAELIYEFEKSRGIYPEYFEEAKRFTQLVGCNNIKELNRYSQEREERRKGFK